MPVVPTSQVRVVPQAPRVDIGAFTPSVDPTGGLGIFTEAAKLPLMFETLDIQRARNKAEKSTLDLKQKELDFTAKNFEAIQTAKQVADQKRLAQEQALYEVKLRRETADAAAAEQKVREGQLVDANTAAAALLPAVNAPAVEYPLEGEGLVDESGEAPSSPFVSGVDASGSYRGDWSKTGAFFTPGRKPSEVWERMTASRVSQLIPATGVTRRELSELSKEAKKIQTELQPRETSVVKVDSEGIPMRIPVTAVGEEVVEILGDPTIDVPTLHKMSPSQAKLDEAVAKRLGEEDPVSRASRQANVAKLTNALTVWQEVNKPGSNVLGSRLIGFLPEGVQALINPEAVLARDQVRSAIQSSLKEALGGAFTQKEGEALMSRAFNLFSTPEINVQLIGQAIQLAETMIRDRDAQAAYFERNGTLRGFKPASGLVNSDGSANLAKVEEIMDGYKKQSAPATGSSPAAGQAVPSALMEESLRRLQEARGSPTPRPTPVPAKP